MKIAREEQVAAKLQEQRAKEALGSESLVDKITGCKTDTDLIKVAKLFKILEKNMTQKEAQETKEIIKTQFEAIKEQSKAKK
jgi:hypothetical protein